MGKFNRKKLQNVNTLKIAAATSVILFSLLACFSGAYAWYNSIRTLDSNADNFSIDKINTAVVGITFHKYLGVTDKIDGTTYYSFDPEDSGGVTFDAQGNPHESGIGIALGEYSLDNPVHPLLIMFSVANGAYQRIDLETDFSFLAEDSGYSLKTTVATFAALNSLDKATLANGDYIKVTADEGHGGVSTIYKYISATRSYDMVWIDLNSGDNPLSSVVQFHSFEFSGTIAENTETYDLNVVNEYGHTVKENDVDGITIDTADFTTTNKSAFADFEDEDTYEYNKEINVYDGDVRGLTYVGIVVNYNSLALEYIFSKYLGHDYLSDGLTFKCDWTTKV